MNADPTWESIDNWYWRSWEVCIGITAACIPALRPGYKTITAGITSYISHRSQLKASDLALITTGDPSHVQAYNPKQKAHAQASHDSALGAAAQAASAEADRSKAHGAGEEGFAMNNLPGDKKTVDQGIKKIARIDANSTREYESQRSLELGDLERGLGNRDFV